MRRAATLRAAIITYSAAHTASDAVLQKSFDAGIILREFADVCLSACLSVWGARLLSGWVAKCGRVGVWVGKDGQGCLCR